MKKIVLSLCLITSMVMSVGLVAQNNDTIVNKSIDNPQSAEEVNTNKKSEWTNSFELFVGVWSLERTVVDAEGKENEIHPGTFMVVHPNASYTIFVSTDVGAVITSQGNIMIQSSDVYVEVISQHVNSSLIGIANRIDYKLGIDYLHKSFWVEKDREGGDYKREVTETWKRATIPVIIMFDDSGAYPI